MQYRFRKKYFLVYAGLSVLILGILFSCVATPQENTTLTNTNTNNNTSTNSSYIDLANGTGLDIKLYMEKRYF
ncbi:MAG: hypothetical protein ACK4TN_01385, partial [Brevinematales bacterium]